MKTQHAAAYGGLIVLNAMISEFGTQLGAGAVPIPSAWAWVVPILIAGITALTILLPRVGSK